MFDRAVKRTLRVIATGVLVSLSFSPQGIAYGSYGYGYHHGHHYHGHRGVHGHVSHHGGVSTAGAVILGILGIVLLAEILDDDRYDHRDRQARVPPATVYQSTATRPAPYARPAPTKPAYLRQHYAGAAGWQKLDAQRPVEAMQIFAVQSQQQLRAGLPRVGFALAAALNGELDRGIWSMRQAMQREASALNQLTVTESLAKQLQLLHQNYASTDVTTPEHDAFMLAALSYLQQDYTEARQYLDQADNSTSSRALRKLIETAES